MLLVPSCWKHEINFLLCFSPSLTSGSSERSIYEVPISHSTHQGGWIAPSQKRCALNPLDVFFKKATAKPRDFLQLNLVHGVDILKVQSNAEDSGEHEMLNNHKCNEMHCKADYAVYQTLFLLSLLDLQNQMQRHICLMINNRQLWLTSQKQQLYQD